MKNRYGRNGYRRIAGFTLAELLIVIAVIAIILGVALPRLGGMREEGNTVKAAAETATLQTAVESYFLHRNPRAYPPEGATWENALVDASTRPRILGAVLTDPFNGTTQYQYDLSPNGQFYVISSVGPDNTAGGLTVSNTGVVTPTTTDDIFRSNGNPGTGGF